VTTDIDPVPVVIAWKLLSGRLVLTAMAAPPLGVRPIAHAALIPTRHWEMEKNVSDVIATTAYLIESCRHEAARVLHPSDLAQWEPSDVDAEWIMAHVARIHGREPDAQEWRWAVHRWDDYRATQEFYVPPADAPVLREGYPDCYQTFAEDEDAAR
jgi:hypothetical protein